MLLAGLLAALAALASLLLTPLVAALMRRLGHTRPDVHKRGQPQLPYSGGVAIFAACMLPLALLAALRPQGAVKVAVLASSSSLALIVGLIDDFKVLGGRLKTLLTILTVVPLLLAHLFAPDHVQLGRPLVPVLGRLRITVIYWALLPLVAAGPANLVNMLDVFNGVMPATSLLSALAMAFASVALGREEGLLLLMPLVGALVGYLPYNWYPARILNGDSGSLFVGAYIGAAAALLQLEYVAAVALVPHVINGVLVVSSGGFKEHREMRGRPTVIMPDYKLAASTDPEAPVSLVRLILSIDGPLGEQQVVKRLVALSGLSSLLAALSSLMIPR